jgi:hypothetical protein
VVAVPVEQQLAVTLIFLAVLVTAATAKAALWRVLQETAGLQYLAARGWESQPQTAHLRRVLALPAQARAAAAAQVAPVLAALAGPVS